MLSEMRKVAYMQSPRLSHGFFPVAQESRREVPRHQPLIHVPGHNRVEELRDGLIQAAAASRGGGSASQETGATNFQLDWPRWPSSPTRALWDSADPVMEVLPNRATSHI